MDGFMSGMACHPLGYGYEIFFLYQIIEKLAKEKNEREVFGSRG
jgi:hypothetical protein